MPKIIGGTVVEVMLQCAVAGKNVSITGSGIEITCKHLARGKPLVGIEQDWEASLLSSY